MAILLKDLDMTKQAKLIDLFTKVSDNYSITNCHNGFVVNISGEDSDEKWITVKHVVKNLDDLKDVVQDLAWMLKI